MFDLLPGLAEAEKKAEAEADKMARVGRKTAEFERKHGRPPDYFSELLPLLNKGD